MKTVLISGGSGLVGKHLCKKLIEKGYDVRILSISKHFVEGVTTFSWNINKNIIEKKAFDNCDYIVHLAGANIGDKRWTTKRKQLIIDSRVKSAQLIFDTIKDAGLTIKAFVSASAIGYYGAVTTNKIFTETDPAAKDFLGETCRVWEQSAERFNDLGIRTVKIRTGAVLTKKGGALAKMITPIKIGLGAALGNGAQYFPWIHIEDLCQIYIKAIEDQEMKGPYNAVAPDDITNKEMFVAIARTLNKHLWFPKIPAFILKLLFGKMADMVLKGSRVSADKLISANFTFKFNNLESALNDLLKSVQK